MLILLLYLELIVSPFSSSSSVIYNIQWSINGSNTFGIMKICSRQGWSELGGVNYCARLGGVVGVSFRLSLMTLYCMFSLESPHRGDSNECTQCTIRQYSKEIHPNISQICSYRVFFLGDQERVRYGRGRRAIIVRAIGVLLF